MSEPTQLKAGARLRAAAGGAEVVIVRAPSSPVSLHCAGAPMAPLTGNEPAAATNADAGDGDRLEVGKRYTEDGTGLELLCTKAGAGPLDVDGRPLELKSAKPLPSSD